MFPESNNLCPVTECTPATKCPSHLSQTASCHYISQTEVTSPLIVDVQSVLSVVPGQGGRSGWRDSSELQDNLLPQPSRLLEVIISDLSNELYYDQST